MTIKTLTNYFRHPKDIIRPVFQRWPWLIPDKIQLKRIFRTQFGRDLDWKNLQTYSEKLQWLKIYDRKPHHTTMVDKYAAKQWIAERIGTEYIIPTLGVWNTFDEIDFDALPSQFVLKTTHDSGGVVVVKDKSTMDYQAAKSKIEDSLGRNFYYLFREWPYKNVPRRIIAEQYLEDESGDLKDYKFYCFNGVPKIMYIAQGFGNPNLPHVIDYFDMEFNHLDLTRHYSMASEIPKKPVNWTFMVELAKVLSKDEIFLRVDFYEVNGRLFIGELTFFPGAGIEKMEPGHWDYTLGQWLKLPFEQ